MADKPTTNGAGNLPRTAEDIQRDIERTRVELAKSIDQLVYRTNPKRVAENAKQTLRERAETPAGRAVIGVTGGLLVLLIVKRIRNR